MHGHDDSCVEVGVLFGLSETEVTELMDVFGKAYLKNKRIIDLAKDIGVFGGGKLALQAYAFGRFVERTQSLKSDDGELKKYTG